MPPPWRGKVFFHRISRVPQRNAGGGKPPKFQENSCNFSGESYRITLPLFPVHSRMMTR